MIAGHDFKFLGAIPARAEASGAQVRQDLWQGHDKHTEPVSRQLVRWADTVFCEWCLGNAVWYSRSLDPKQRLVVRYHRQERETGFPARVEIDRVHRVVFVGRHLLDEAAERFGWPEEKLLVVPNAIDIEALTATQGLLELLQPGPGRLRAVAQAPGPRPGPDRAPPQRGWQVSTSPQGPTPLGS